MSAKERIKEIRALPTEELNIEIGKIRDKVFKLRFQGKGKNVENPGQMKALKKDVARMFTVMNQRAVRSNGGKA